MSVTARYITAGLEAARLCLTPGGRLGSSALASLARALEDHMQLIEWDRSNTGSSDLYLDAPPEQYRWADDAALLVEHLGLGRAIFIGGSAGSRLAYLTAIRHPQVVSGLILWSVSGGGYSSQLLGYQYHTPYIEAAVRGGMAEVAETPHFSELIRANPGNAARLLDMDADTFIAVMKSWNEVFYPTMAAPVIAATVSELRTVTAPTLVFNGNDDSIRPSPRRHCMRRSRLASPAVRMDPRRLDVALRRPNPRERGGTLPAHV